MSCENESRETSPDPIEIPIDGVLDLHSFSPKQVKDLVLDYLDACQKQDICTVRIIHGKGIGALKRTVHALLRSHPAVIEYYLDSTLFSGDGATIVRLRRQSPDKPPA